MWIDVDDMVRILEAGRNIVSTAAFITGHSLGAGRRRIADACDRGGTSVFGSGINPGFADLLALVTRERVRPHRQVHADRVGGHHGLRLPRDRAPGRVRPSDRRPRPARDDGQRHGGVRGRCAPAGRGARRRARRGGLRGRVRGHHRGPRPRLLGSRGGCVAGIAASWHGRVGGRTVVELRVRWRKGQTPRAGLADRPGYLIEIDGRPTIRTKVDLLPPRTSRPRPSRSSWCSA